MYLSDTQSADAFSVEQVTQKINGVDHACKLIKFGTRSCIVRDEVGPGTYLQIVESYGGPISEAGEWLVMLANRLVQLDGVPLFPGMKRAEVERMLDKLGNDGVSAISRAYAVPESEKADTIAVMGNS